MENYTATMHRFIFNDLTNTPMTNVQYEFTRHIWNIFQCRTLQDLLTIYLKVYVALLADVIQAFKQLSLRYYKIDPT